MKTFLFPASIKYYHFTGALTKASSCLGSSLSTHQAQAADNESRLFRVGLNGTISCRLRTRVRV